jgi:hypothetical protein
MVSSARTYTRAWRTWITRVTNSCAKTVWVTRGTSTKTTCCISAYAVGGPAHPLLTAPRSNALGITPNHLLRKMSIGINGGARGRMYTLESYSMIRSENSTSWLFMNRETLLSYTLTKRTFLSLTQSLKVLVFGGTLNEITISIILWTSKISFMMRHSKI